MEIDLTKWNALREAAGKLTAELRELSLREQEARNLERQERIRLAGLGYGAPLPLGSKVVRWQETRSGGWVKTKDVGTLEVLLPENRDTFSKAQSGSFGSFVIRVNGGKKFTECEVAWKTGKLGLPYRWYAEGVEPEALPRLRTEDL